MADLPCDCGAAAEPGRRRCTSCRTALAEKSAQRYHALVAAGRCASCSAPADAGTCCARCAEKRRAARAARSSGRAPHRPRAAKCDAYVARYQAGESAAAIARDVGVHPASVRDALVRRGVWAAAARVRAVMAGLWARETGR